MWPRGAASSMSRSSLMSLLVARRVAAFSSLVTDLVLDALEQSMYDRCGARVGDLVHHSDRGTQYLSMPSASPTPASSRPSATVAIPTTTRSPNRSSGCSRRR
jgi:hypothetical protein